MISAYTIIIIEVNINDNTPLKIKENIHINQIRHSITKSYNKYRSLRNNFLQ